MSLSFSNPRFEDVKASIEECKDKDMTYAAPLFVTAEFTNNTTGEIKSQTVFMGDFPMMTPQGHVHHQRHRAGRRVASSSARRASTSTGRWTRPPTSTSTASRSSRAAAPGSSSTSTSARRSACASTASAASRSPCCSRPWAGAQIGSGSTSAGRETLLATLEKDHIAGHGRGAAGHLPQAAPGRAADARVRAGAAGEPVLQPQALRPGQGRPVQGEQEARRQPSRSRTAR